MSKEFQWSSHSPGAGGYGVEESKVRFVWWAGLKYYHNDGDGPEMGRSYRC
ncbi:MAG TPA: hypothetical protein VMY43_00665 [Methanothrix sp.]|nr:hypothetical protein [Methanothrix sp.]